MSIYAVTNGSGVELVPAGKCSPWIKYTTTDRLNMSNGSVTVTAVDGSSFECTVNGTTSTGTSFNVPLDQDGRGRVTIDSGKRYNFHLNHQGNYANDGDQQLDAKSTEAPWVNFELVSYPSVSTVTTVKATYQGAGVDDVSVVASSGTMNINGITDSSGTAILRGLDTGNWVVDLPDYNLSKNLTVDMLMEELSFNLGGINATVTRIAENVTISGNGVNQTKAPVNGVASFGPLPAGTYTVSTAHDSQTVVVSEGMASISVMGGYHRWTARINFSVSDPDDSVEYLNDAAGLTPAQGHNMNGWAGSDLLATVAPCVVNSSRVKTYLNKRDLTKTIAGAASNIATAGNDAFTEFRKLYLALYTSGNYIYIEFSEAKIDNNFLAYAHTFNNVEQSAFYVGCFAATVSNSRVYSQSGTSPTVSTSIANFISYAQARGSGYDIMKWYHLIYIQCFFIMLYKSLDSQTALGRGYVGGSSRQSNSLTTFDNDYGLAGSTSSTQQMAFLWITNLWGNIYQFVGGAKTNSSRQLMTIMGANSSVTESAFTSRGITGSSSSGYISRVAGSALGGFFPTQCSGSATTYWCDLGIVYTSYFPYVGGLWSNGDGAGLFYVYFYHSSSGTGASIGSRLSYSLGIA